MRVCFFGDSFTAGIGDPEGLGWTGRAARAARQAGHDLTAYALGVRQNTTTDIARRWRAEALERLAADAPGGLVFAFGTNDCLPGDDAGVRVAPALALAQAEAILAAARAWRPTLMVGPLPVLDDTEADRRIADLSRALAGLCRNLAVPYLAVFASVSGSSLWRAEAEAGDGSHPGAGAYAFLAELFIAWPAWQAVLAGAGHPR